jgi:hypothetical protein
MNVPPGPAVAATSGCCWGNNDAVSELFSCQQESGTRDNEMVSLILQHLQSITPALQQTSRTDLARAIEADGESTGPDRQPVLFSWRMDAEDAWLVLFCKGNL